MTGIDVSNHQNTAANSARQEIDWGQVAESGIEFVWAKATEGATSAYPFFYDGHLGENTGGARGAGIPAGGYDFARPLPLQDPRDEARRFAVYLLDNGLLSAESLRPMLDVEDLGVNDWWIAEWIDEFRKATGVRRVIVYASRSFWLTHLHPEQWADEDVLLWLADYDYSTESVKWNHPQLAVKQYRSDGAVPGLVGGIDMNTLVNGFSVEDLLIGGDDMGTVNDFTPDALSQLFYGYPVNTPDPDSDPNGVLNLAAALDEARLANNNTNVIIGLLAQWREVTADDLAGALETRLTAAMLPTLVAALRDAAQELDGVNLTPETVDALSTATVNKLARRLTPQAPADLKVVS